MEFSLSGNSLKIFARSVTCLARIGTELVFQSSSSQLTLNTLNSSRSAFQSITFKQDFFDVYTVSGAQVKCSVLLKAICSVLRTPLSNIERLAVLLSDPGASKLQWTLNCNSGMKKTYWVTCTIEPDFQHLSLDREKFPSSFVVRPRDLNRLLANFQTNLQEITVIATEPFVAPPDAIDQIGGKAVELRSYIDPTKENDSSLHTQLWIDPGEEFVQYTHTGHPVDVTFGVKELKAFLSFCESCEVDIHLYFDKAGEPILMVPKFGLDDGPGSNFDTTLVLATMLVSQIDAGNSSEPPTSGDIGATPRQGTNGNTANPSEHTKIWSELSGSAAKGGNNAESRQFPDVRNQSTRERSTVQQERTVNISTDVAAELIRHPEDFHSTEPDEPRQQQQQPGDDTRVFSQRHPRNWVDADEDDDDDTDDSELCIQSTPPRS